MTKLTLDADTLLKRLNGIQNEIRELQALAEMPFEKFKNDIGFKLAQFHLHRALEGVFHIGTHILSRIPGAQVSEYKGIARKLGEIGIVDKTFAETTLVKMAGYRNRIVHFYADITPSEIYDLIKYHLTDIDVFSAGVKRVLEHPEQFGIAKGD